MKVKDDEKYGLPLKLKNSIWTFQNLLHVLMNKCINSEKKNYIVKHLDIDHLIYYISVYLLCIVVIKRRCL